MTEVDFDTRKYMRSAFIPDYRETMFPDEPQYTHEIPFAPQSAVGSTRHSVWSAEPQNDFYSRGKTNGYSTTISRRNSVAPIFAKKAAAEASDTASSVWRYSSSPSKTDLTNGHTNGTTNGNFTTKTSNAPVFAQRSSTVSGAENGQTSRRNSNSPGPVLKSKSGLVYGHSNLHNGDGPLLSPTEETDQSSAASFKTARENGAPSTRRYSDGAGLTAKNNYYSYAVQQPMPQQQPNGTDSRPSRRYSDLSALNGGPYPPRNVSPVDSRRSVAMGQVSRSGAVSPITTYRSSSPMGNRPRNGTTTSTATNLVSPMTARPNGGFSSTASIRSGSPSAQMSMTSPLARNSMAPPQQPTGAASAQQPQKLSLNTQLAAAGTKKSPTPSEAEEEMDEVIALSPAGRAPIQNFRRSRSSLMLSATPIESSAQSLNTLVEDTDASGKRYFGQDVNMDDLVANNLENAFSRL